NLGVGCTVIEKPLILEKHQPFQEAHVIYLSGDLIGLCRTEEIFICAIKDTCGVIEVQKYLTGRISSGGQFRVTILRMIAGIVKKEDALICDHGGRSGLDKVAVEHSLSRGNYGKKIFAIFSYQWRPVDQIIRRCSKNVRVAEVHPVLSVNARSHKPFVLQTCD